jgi:hypothetical protein
VFLLSRRFPALVSLSVTYLGAISALLAQTPPDVPPSSQIDWSTVWAHVGHVADIFSLIGLPLALLGLRLAYREAQLAKTASQAATTAVQKFREDLNLSNSVADFTKALSITHEIKRLIRNTTFAPLPDRLSEMRLILVGIRASDIGLTDEESATFQSAIMNFRRLEGKVDNIIATNVIPPNISALTQPICSDVDSLHEILTHLKSKIGAP